MNQIRSEDRAAEIVVDLDRDLVQARGPGNVNDQGEALLQDVVPVVSIYHLTKHARQELAKVIKDRGMGGEYSVSPGFPGGEGSGEGLLLHIGGEEAHSELRSTLVEVLQTSALALMDWAAERDFVWVRLVYSTEARFLVPELPLYPPN